MQSVNINQLLMNGLVPLSYGSEHVAHHIFDLHMDEEYLSNNSSQQTADKVKLDISTAFNVFSQHSSLSNSIVQTILAHTSSINKNIAILLRSALISGNGSFRHALQDLKITHKRTFAQEINQYDQHQNSLLWYLAVANLYSSIQELYQFAVVELNINIPNGPLEQTILHYAVINSNIDEIRLVLDTGIDINLRDRFGRSALHYIALYGSKDRNDIEIIKLLLNYDALANLEDNNHQTSLHHAIQRENYDLVKYLITLSSINVCIRDKHGFTPLCYLCEHILRLSDISLANNQYNDILEDIFQIMNLIVDHCPPDELSYNFHITKNAKLNENLLLHVYNKLTSIQIPLPIDTFFYRCKSIIIGTNEDHRLLVERLLQVHSWKSAVLALCNTHNVNISKSLIECIAHDPHVALADHISPSSDLSNVFVLIFYALATDMKLLRTIVPMCQYLTDDKSKMLNTCQLYINNLNLHTTFVTFIHTCLHDARLNVFSLKHLCRYHIRNCLQSNITDKIEQCSHLKAKYRDYLKLNELQFIYFNISNLSSIGSFIERLYNIHPFNERISFEDDTSESSQISTNKIDVSTIPSSVDTSSYQHTVQLVSTTTEDLKFVRQRTVEELMVESDISLIDSIELKPSSGNLSLERNHSSDEKMSTEQFENELAGMNAKSKDIENMIEKFLLNK